MGGGASVHKVGADALLQEVSRDARIGAVTKEEAIDAIAVASCGSATAPQEEVAGWILGPKWRAFNSPERMDLCTYNAKFAVASCTKKGTIIGLRDPETKEVLGVMLVRRTYETDGEMVSTAFSLGTPPHMKTKVYGKEPQKRDGGIITAMKALKYTGGPQYIIYMLAVKPSAQGKGVAKALVNALFAVGDREQLPVTVDCAGERLEKLYTHLGFQKRVEAKAEDPTKQEGSGPLGMVGLIRAPAPALTGPGSES